MSTQKEPSLLCTFLYLFMPSAEHMTFDLGDRPSP